MQRDINIGKIVANLQLLKNLDFKCYREYYEIKAKVVLFTKLVKCGWEHMDNSTLMLLRLLDMIYVSSIAIVSFDGYEYTTEKQQNHALNYLELPESIVYFVETNHEIEEMLTDYYNTRTHKDTLLQFLTPSRF